MNDVTFDVSLGCITQVKKEMAESSWSRTNPRVANTLHQV